MCSKRYDPWSRRWWDGATPSLKDRTEWQVGSVGDACPTLLFLFGARRALPVMPRPGTPFQRRKRGVN
jgi:hypothetical protein